MADNEDVETYSTLKIAFDCDRVENKPICLREDTGIVYWKASDQPLKNAHEPRSSKEDKQNEKKPNVSPEVKPSMDKQPSPQEMMSLRSKIEDYNRRRASRGSGLGLTLLDDGISFRGFLKVHFNLTRPINIIAGKRPPSIYDIINEENSIKRGTLTSFYMPRDTVKNIHITSDATSLDVIKAMLKKFKIVDDPQKFALYLRFKDPANSEMVLKRMDDNDLPLKTALDLDNEEGEDQQIVLQENDTCDVCWDAFAVPELANFLKILEKEEEDHLSEVRQKYANLRRTLLALIKDAELQAMIRDPEFQEEDEAAKEQFDETSLLTQACSLL